jgi:hypothetical protein
MLVRARRAEGLGACAEEAGNWELYNGLHE